MTPTLVTDQVYRYLEDEILSGRMPGGTRLRVRNVAELVGTSVMPVREAISRLEDNGLADRVPHKGAVVREFSVTELVDIYAVRLVLETEAARLGAKHITSEGVTSMRSWLEKGRESLAAADSLALLEADVGMLLELYRASGNEYLCDLINAQWKQCHMYRLTATQNDTKVHGRSLYLLDRQGKIIEAAASGDAEAAANATRLSIEAAIETLLANQ